MGRRKSVTTRGSREKDKQRKRQNRQQIQESFVFHPVDKAWREARAAELGLPVPAQDRGRTNPPAVSPTPLLPPNAFYHTRPDGNCFFNAISFILTGHEHFQHIMRRAICTQLTRFKDELTTYIPSRYNGDVEEYLIDSGMRDNQTWATETEIFAAAHLLKTNIFVYTQHGARWTWLRHAPMNTVSGCGIYLYHHNRNHYDIVIGIQQEERKLTKTEQNKSRYAKDSTQIKEKAKTKYQKDGDFRERKRRKVTEKYATDKHYKEKVIMDKNKQYSSDPKFRENIQSKSREYQRRQKGKYTKDKVYREQKKTAAKLKYDIDKVYREKKKKAAKERYWTQEAYRHYKKVASLIKYSTSSAFRKHVQKFAVFKYRENRMFRDKVKMYSTQKYKERKTFRESVKEYSKRKYRHDKCFGTSLRASSIKRYASRPLFRLRLLNKLRQQYQNKDIQTKKKEDVKIRRKSLQAALQTFKRHINDTPRYVCTVCARILYRNQVKVCNRNKYMENDVLFEIAEKCLTGKYLFESKEWICKTCDSHLSVRNMPPQALANGLTLQPIPEVLKRLNSLERQLVALRIPFMRLLSLPRGGQKGVKGQVVNVPSNLNSVTTSLPRTVEGAQMVKVKLKRKLSYKGHHQYEWVNPDKVMEAVKYLVANNSWYSGITVNSDWCDDGDDSDIVRTAISGFDSDDEESTKLQEENTKLNKESSQPEPRKVHHENTPHPITEEDLQPHPVETCSQPLDLGQEYLDTNNKVFCVAPGENQIPQSMFQEKGADAMAFPVAHPDGKFGFSADREIALTPSKYFNARLFCADNRFSNNNQFIFYAQFMTEIYNIRSNISIALRKGKQITNDGKKVTASTLTNTDNLQQLLKSDAGFRFLQPVRGTPPYWQRTMKDLYAIIRQLGIPTWFITFSAAETRWKEVLNVLKTDDTRDVMEIEWTDKCKLVKENPVMCARLFNNRVKNLFTDLIMSPARPIGHVVDFFYRTEFQQRGSPHIHCLFWIKDAPKLDSSTDADICNFIDQHISCEMPDPKNDPELHGIVTSVQMHSKSHTKSCKKKSSTCRFRFPRPPIKKTFIARPETENEDIEYIPKEDRKPPTAKEFEEICNKATARSAREIVKDVWTVINSVDNIEDYTIKDILQSANISYSEFTESLKAIATRTSVYHKRNLTDSWINNYNPLLLRAWNANMDIQYVTDPYSCVAYILSYISKAEAEVGELLSDAKKEAKEGNKDAAAAMKKIGQVYIQNREVSAQEAVYRVCSMHLKDCSRQVLFVPTGSNAIKMSLPISNLKSKAEDSENIWMPSVIDKYFARPDTDNFEDLCLAEFCSHYTIHPNSRPPKQSQIPGALAVYKLQDGMGFIKRRKNGKEAVIRYPRFNRLRNPDEFYLTLLQLYMPHRQPIVKPSEFKTFEEYVRHGRKDDLLLFDTINKKRDQFELDADDLEKAWDDVQEGRIGEDAWSLIAPEAEAERLEDQKGKVSLTEDDEENSPDVDLLGESEHQHKVSAQAVEFQQPKTSKKEMQNCLRNMNDTQQRIFYKVREWTLQVAWKKHPEPFHLFVTGGAGTGKSHLIKCIYHDCTRILSKTLDNPDASPVLLTAPTGTAAYNIGGVTLHSGFSISKNIRLPYTPLGESTLNTLRAKLDCLRLVIIDEVSMVDHKLLTYVHGRLSQLKQSKQYFGNVAILAVGDFYQLPPVKASPLYKINTNVVLDLWNPLFSIATLTEVMRQKGDSQFAAMLNRLRTHLRKEPFLPEDMDMLNSVSRDSVPNNMRKVLHIFSTNKQVEEHNDEMVAVVCNPCVTCTANDFTRSTVSGQLVQRDQPYSSTSQEDLLPVIKLGIGARVMLTRNIDTEDGLVNGAFGSVTALHQAKNGDVKAVYVKFDNADTGKKLMSTTVSAIPGSKGAVRISQVEDSICRKNAVRKQFPLKLGWAATIHKVQGMTTKNIVVSLKKVFQPGMAYVALSRATSLSGLHILNLDTDTIYASEEINKALENMPTFLPLQSQEMTEKRTVNIVLHNTEGLIPHKEDIVNSKIISHANVICFTETWLNKNNSIPSSFLPGHEVHTLHRAGAYSTTQTIFKHLSSMARGGVAVFVGQNFLHTRTNISIQNLEYVAVTLRDPVVTVVTIYRPPSYPVKEFSSTLSNLLSVIENTITNPVIIVGDFNDNALSQTTHFQETYEEYGYKQLVEKPTTESGTCLDLVLVKRFRKDPQITVCPLYYSFHDAVRVSIALE